MDPKPKWNGMEVYNFHDAFKRLNELDMIDRVQELCYALARRPVGQTRQAASQWRRQTFEKHHWKPEERFFTNLRYACDAYDEKSHVAVELESELVEGIMKDRFNVKPFVS